MATTDVGTGAVTAAAIMAFSFGGVTTEHFILGCVCYNVGAACRAGLKITSAYEANQKPNWGAMIGTLSVAPLLAAFASMTAFFTAHIAGFEGEAGIGLLLCIAALKGPEGIQLLAAFVSKAIPQAIAGANKQEPKP